MKNFGKKFQKQLNKFHDFYFGIEAEEPKKKPLKDEDFPLNSIWIFKDKNPFKRFKVEIKDVKEGHVLYRHCVSKSLFQDESCTMASFVNMYKKDK